MTPQLPRLVRRNVAAAAVLALAFTAALAAPLDDIRRQVEASQFELAYQTAQANPQLVGDPHFDFPYGVAAISVGRVPEGVLALERHLAAVPANDRARLELARGYFLLGEYPRARSEFEFVLRYNPPAGVRARIAGFLQAMQVREATDRRASARFYAEVGVGHDSNVNLGTYRDALQLGFGTVELAPGSPSRQVKDSFGQLALGGQQQLRVTNRLSVFAGADLDVRGNLNAHQYDLTTAGANIGFSQLSNATLWRTTLGISQMMVGGNRYRNAVLLSTDAGISLDAERTLSLFGNYAEIRHSVTDEVRDARSFTLGAMLNHSYADVAGSPALGARLSYTQEDNATLRKDLSKQVPMLRVFGSINSGDRLRLTLGLSAYLQDFQGEDIGFGSVRHDETSAIDLAANYAIDARLTLRADAAWSHTKSNQSLYDSRRVAASLKLRYQF